MCICTYAHVWLNGRMSVHCHICSVHINRIAEDIW